MLARGLGLSRLRPWLWLSLPGMPIISPAHDFFLLVPVALLNASDNFVVIPFDLLEIVIGEFPPLLFDFSSELHPFSFELIRIHRNPPC